MKSLTLLLALLTTSLSLQAQLLSWVHPSGSDQSPAYVYGTTVDKNNDMYVFGDFIGPNGSIGSFDFNQTGRSGFIARLNAKGKVTFSLLVPTTVHRCVVSADLSLFVTSWDQSTAATVLKKFDKNGKDVWTKTLTTKTPNYPEMLHMLPNGNVLVVQQNAYNNDPNGVFFRIIDPVTGNELYKSSNVAGQIMDVTVDDKGAIYMAERGQILKLDSKGKKIGSLALSDGDDVRLAFANGSLHAIANFSKSVTVGTQKIHGNTLYDRYVKYGKSSVLIKTDADFKQTSTVRLMNYTAENISVNSTGNIGVSGYNAADDVYIGDIKLAAADVKQSLLLHFDKKLDNQWTFNPGINLSYGDAYIEYIGNQVYTTGSITNLQGNQSFAESTIKITKKGFYLASVGTAVQKPASRTIQVVTKEQASGASQAKVKPNTKFYLSWNENGTRQYHWGVTDNTGKALVKLSSINPNSYIRGMVYDDLIGTKSSHFSNSKAANTINLTLVGKKGQDCAASFYLDEKKSTTKKVIVVNKSKTLTKNKYRWSFGDAQFSTQDLPTHNYIKKGTYELCLSLESTAGATYCKDSICKPLSVSGGSGGFILEVQNPSGTTLIEPIYSKAPTFQVFPNPVIGTDLNIMHNGTTELAQVQLYSTVGELLFEQPNMPIENGVNFIPNVLEQSGTYMLVISTLNQVQTIQLVKP